MNWMHVLTFIFVVAKLMGYISWPWLLVLAPSIISISIGALVLLVVLFVAMTR